MGALLDHYSPVMLSYLYSKSYNKYNRPLQFMSENGEVAVAHLFVRVFTLALFRLGSQQQTAKSGGKIIIIYLLFLFKII
jgi:uncharacterized YccA/Bax inhibitor family protein